MKKICWVVTMMAAVSLWAENSAPSMHMVFENRGDADILIGEVRVPKEGVAKCTYYETLGWSGLGAGYGGIQAHPKANLYIFSIWDNKRHTAPIKAVHHGPGTKTTKFGGEGTGLKSWNFDLGWSPDVWYTLVARCWEAGDHTHFGFWSRAGDTGKWTHLVTMDVAAPKAWFRGSTDAFLEDWSRTGASQRVMHMRGSWKRKVDGSWIAAESARYSVNKWDLPKGKRSYNSRNSWDAGVSDDATGPFYYMISGGASTKSTTTNPAKFSLAREETVPNYDKIRVKDLSLQVKDKSIAVTWENDDTTLPQFSYRLQVFADRSCKGEALLSHMATVAHARSETLDAANLDLTGKTYYIHLVCADILGNVSEPEVTATK